MTPQRLGEVLDALGWSDRQLARLLECNYSTVKRWLNGKQETAPKVAEWLEHRVSTATPPPLDWQRKRGPKPRDPTAEVASIDE